MFPLSPKNSRVFRLFLLFSIFALLLGAVVYRLTQPVGRVEAVGDLDFTYLGTGLDDPIFQISGFLPGDCTTRTVDASNSGPNLAKVAVKGELVSETGALSTVLSMVISQGTTDLYGGTHVDGPKTVAEFFTDSSTEDGVKLTNIPSGNSTSYDFTVCFDSSAGNEFQLTEVIFDLVFGEIIVPVELPEVCQDLEGIVTEVITGTPGNDKINGTTASELIEGLAGNDKIEGGGGDDCIIGGDGDDRIDGGTGRDYIDAGEGNDRVNNSTHDDVIYGRGGNDRLEGGSGNDYIDAGPGNDRVDGGSDNDLIYGRDGNDRLDGGSGDDYIYGEAGNDNIDGGSDADHLYGGTGNDRLDGASGNDFLDGQEDHDNLDGSAGTDTCVNGEVLSSCEL